MRKTALLLFATFAFALQVRLAPAEAPAAGEGHLKSLAVSAWDFDKARHLLYRAGFGGSPAEVEKLHAMGLNKAVDYLVDFDNQPDGGLPSFPSLQQSTPIPGEKQLDPKELKKLKAENGRIAAQNWHVVREWWIRRLVESPRPLEEQMVLFWHSFITTNSRSYQPVLKQNQLFRQHAAGNYGELLRGVVHDPAMIKYLDNDKNTKGRPNENLARELMELFSMGEGQGYTEQDIKEAARALTGYHYDPKTWEFTFNEDRHDGGVKTVFGEKGNWNGDTLVDLILEQPATPKFIAKKLFTYFVQDEPDQAVIDQLARLLKDGNYELKPVLKTLFRSEYFYSPEVIGNLIKNPVRLVVGTIRTLALDDVDLRQVAANLVTMEQPLFQPLTVKGWDGGKEWLNSSTVITRQNFAVLTMSTGFENQPKPQVPLGPLQEPKMGAVGRIDVVAMLQSQKLETPQAVVDYFLRALFPAPQRESRRAELVAFLGQLPPSSQWAERHEEISRQLGTLLILMMSMPEYQLT